MTAVMPTGTSATQLTVLRGNSGSGKSTVARAVRERYGRGCAPVEQDYPRRIVLRELDGDRASRSSTDPVRGAAD